MKQQNSTCQRRSVFAVILVLLIFCIQPYGVIAKERSKNVHAASEGQSTQDDTKDEECKPVGQCERCLSGERSREECKATGKRQQYECVVTLDDGKDDYTTTFRSCKRTSADEEFLMVQMQAFCFLMGFLAVLSVRKQKMLSLSLFDQRRIQNSKRRSSDTGPLTLEMAKQQEETAPLTQSSSIDVV